MSVKCNSWRNPVAACQSSWTTELQLHAFMPQSVTSLSSTFTPKKRRETLQEAELHHHSCLGIQGYLDNVYPHCEIRKAATETCKNGTHLKPSLFSLTLQLWFRKWSLARPQSHGFAGESWVGAPPLFSPEPAQGILPVPLRLRLRHVPQNHVTQLLHQQWGVSTEPSFGSIMLRTGWKHVFFKPTVSTHAHHSNYTLSQSTQHWEWDCNYASIMLMKSWWILIILTVVLCFLVCFSVSLKNLKPFMCFRDFFSCLDPHRSL